MNSTDKKQKQEICTEIKKTVEQLNAQITTAASLGLQVLMNKHSYLATSPNMPQSVKIVEETIYCEIKPQSTILPQALIAEEERPTDQSSSLKI